MTGDNLGPPPVEPLSDVTWARVERGLWARMDGSVTIQTRAPSRSWLRIGAPMLAVAAVIAIVVITRDAPSTVEVADRGSDASDVRVVAPPNAPTSASFNDAHIELAPATALVMRHDRPTTVLERGAAWFVVAPRINHATGVADGSRPPFIVIAGDTTVRVIGTKFRVARSDDRVVVEVDHGTVEVTFRGRLEVIRDRQTWSSDEPDRVIALATTASADDVIEFEPTQVRRRPKLKAVERTEPKPIAVEGTPEPTKAHIAPAERDLDREKFERLAVLEKKNPRAAMTGYLELSKDSGKWAANALYAAGRLAADRKDPRAATLLKVYLRRFPAGANVEDARALLVRLPAP
jgi:hypothetical protein